MTQKVSLSWLAYSNDPLAVKYRGAIEQGTTKCVLCCMFFGDEYEDDEGHKSICHFNEIDESEIEHFQQMANLQGFDIKIVSLGDKKDDQKEVVQFT